jgi:hypothetical protein
MELPEKLRRQDDRENVLYFWQGKAKYELHIICSHRKSSVFKSIISICSYTHITGILWVWLIQKLDWEKNNTFHIVSYDLAWPANSREQSRLEKPNSSILTKYLSTWSFISNGTRDILILQLY